MQFSLVCKECGARFRYVSSFATPRGTTIGGFCWLDVCSLECAELLQVRATLAIQGDGGLHKMRFPVHGRRHSFSGDEVFYAKDVQRGVYAYIVRKLYNNVEKAP